MTNTIDNIGYLPQMPVCDRHLSVELNSDFTLPDYQVEIRRLLSTKVEILPPTEFISNGNASFEGDVRIKILYLGADNKIYCTSLTDKYKYEAPLEFNAYNVSTDDVTLIPSCRCESTNTRVLAPRKLNVRLKLSCHVQAYSPEFHSPRILGPHTPASIESRIFEAPAMNVKLCASEPIVLSDFIALESELDDMRIIELYSHVLIAECIPTRDKVSLRGELNMKLLYCNDAQSDYPLTLVRKIPFSTSVSCDGVTNAFECCAGGTVIDEQINIDESGVKVELTVIASVRAQKKEDVAYISDAYSTERTAECKSIDLSIPVHVRCFDGNLTQNNSFSLEEIKLSQNAKIIDTCSTARVNDIAIEGGKLFLSGVSEHQLIYFCDDEYSSKILTSPFRYEVEGRYDTFDPDLMKWCVEAKASHPRARHDGERLFIDCELCFCISLQVSSNISILDEMILGESFGNEDADMVLCYPEKDSELWSIAKQYGKPQKRIRAQNSIPEGEETVKKRFLII